MSAGLDPRFTTLPLDALADAALSRAKALGATHADVRIARIRNGERRLRDGALESSTDATDLGIGVRVIHSRSWGFAAGITLTTDAAASLADQAVAAARISRPLTSRPVELAPEPVHVGEWVSPFRIDPFDVDDAERIERLVQLSRSATGPGVDHVTAALDMIDEHKFYADLVGSRTVQRRVRVFPQDEVMSTSDGYHSMRATNPPAARGWEFVAFGEGWDLDAEVAQLPTWLAEQVAAPSIEAGRYDLVIEPTNLWLRIHESVAHATELDRALGYEAAYAGTSFATIDTLGSLRYGSDVMAVTGDRVAGDGHDVTAVAQAAERVDGRERGAGVRGLVAERPVQLGRVGHGLVDRQPQVRGFDHEVVPPCLDRRRRDLLGEPGRELRYLGVEVPALAKGHELPAARGWRVRRTHRVVAVGRGHDLDLGEDPYAALYGAASGQVRIELVLVDHVEGRRDVVDARPRRTPRQLHEPFDPLGVVDVERVDPERRDPLTDVYGLGGQLDRS